MADSTGSDPWLPAALERRVMEILKLPDDQSRSALEELYREHPEHASRIRERLASARQLHANIDVLLGEQEQPERVGRILYVLGEGVMPGPGETLGDFKVLGLLGRGGMGTVHLAEQISMHRRVALKLIRPDLLDRPRSRERFRREIEAASKLEHPGICTVYDAGEIEGVPYIAMRYVEGESLAGRVARLRASGSTTTRRSLTTILELIERVARALHYAHEHGLVHRDVKPGNVIVTTGDEPVLLDFGLAQMESSGHSLTATGEALGTPAYMSPEQVSGRPVDRRTDVYSLGVTLFECLTLHLPFEAPTREALYRQILTAPPSASLQTNKTIPRDLRVVVATAMEREPTRRYDSAQALADDLRHILDLEPITARPPGLLERTWRWARREPFRAAVVGLLAVGLPVLGSLGGYLLGKQDEIRAGEAALAAERVDRALARATNELLEGSLVAAIAEFERVLAIAPSNPEALGGLALALDRDRQAERARAILARWPGRAPATLRAYVERDRQRFADGLAPVQLGPDPSAVELFFAGLIELQRYEAEVYGAAKRAAAFLQEACLRTPRPRLVYWWELTHAAGHTGNPEQIRACVRALHEHWPDRPIVWLACAKALVGVDDAAAERHCQRLLAGGEHEFGARLVLGNLHRERGQLDAAHREFTQAAALEPDQVVALHNLANVEEDRGNYEQAIVHLRAALARKTDSAKAHRQLANVLGLAGRLEESLESCEAALLIDPESALARSDCGHLLIMLGEGERGVVELERAIATDRRLPTPYDNLALYYEGRDELDLAEATYAKLRAAAPDLVHAHLASCNHYLRRGEVDAALLHFDAAIARAPPVRLEYRTPWQSFARAGAALAKKSEFDRAARAFQRALDLGCADRQVYLNLPRLLVAAGSLEEALTAADRSIENHPEDAEVYENRGRVLRQLGRWREAADVYRTAVSRDERNGEWHWRLGGLLFETGRPGPAVDALRTAVERLPQHRGAAWDLGRALLAFGRHAEAQPHLERSLLLSANQDWLAVAQPSVQRSGRELDRIPAWERMLAEEVPPDPTELLPLATYAARTERDAAAVTLFDRAVAEGVENIWQDGGAIEAVGASVRLGKADAADPGRAREMRARALRWLRQGLAALRTQASAEQSTTLAAVRRQLLTWREWVPLGPIRDDDQLARLAPEESRELSDFWDEVEELLGTIPRR